MLDSERSPLNPHWFPLGSILIYVLVFFRSVAELFTDMNAMDMRFIARPLSALVDTGSVFLVYLLGRRLYGTPVGLLAAALAALAVIHVQHSHFYRPETFTVFFTLASFWAMLRMSFEPTRRRLRDSVILGLMLGLALAPKVNVLPLLAPLAVVYFYRVLDEVEGRWTDVTPDLVQRMAGHAVLCGLVAVGVLFVTSPYAFLDVGDFVEDLTFQTRMAGNAGLVPFTIQYVDTPAFLYQVSQSSVWGLGIPLGVVVWLAVPFTVILAFTSAATRRADLLLLAWVVPSFLFLENFEVRFLRYIFPLVPVMIILAARMLVWLWDNHALISGQAARIGVVLKGQVRIAVAAVVVFVVLSTAFYSLAFQRVYAGRPSGAGRVQLVRRERAGRNADSPRQTIGTSTYRISTATTSGNSRLRGRYPGQDGAIGPSIVPFQVPGVLQRPALRQCRPGPGTLPPEQLLLPAAIRR